MNLCDYFSYKTLFYFLKDNSYFNTPAFKECFVEDSNGLPAKKYTKDILDRLFGERFDNDDEMVVIKTKYGSFVYHKANEPDYAKQMLKAFSKNAPCGVFGSYRTTDVYTFGFANNGKVERYIYTGDDDIISEGSKTEYETTHPFKLLGEEETMPEEVDYIDEEYVFQIAKWFAGFDIETQEVKILDIKIYKPCSFDGNIDASAPLKVAKNFKAAGIDSIGIMVSHDKSCKSVVISCENVDDDGNRHIVYCDEIGGIKDKKEMLLSLKRCIQAIYNLDLTKSNETLFDINNFYTKVKDPDSSIAFILIDTEKKFMVGVSKYQYKGKRLPTETNYVPYTNLFYNLGETTLKDVLKQAIKLIK